MLNTIKFSIKLLIFALCSLLCLTSQSAAQDQIHITVTAPGANRTPIALPSTKSELPAAAEFHKIIQRDLEFSGWVEVVDPRTYIEKDAGVKPGEFKYSSWTHTTAVALAKTSPQHPRR